MQHQADRPLLTDASVGYGSLPPSRKSAQQYASVGYGSVPSSRKSVQQDDDRRFMRAAAAIFIAAAVLVLIVLDPMGHRSAGQGIRAAAAAAAAVSFVQMDARSIYHLAPGGRVENYRRYLSNGPPQTEASCLRDFPSEYRSVCMAQFEKSKLQTLEQELSAMTTAAWQRQSSRRR